MNFRHFPYLLALSSSFFVGIGEAHAQTAPPITTAPIFSDEFSASQLDLGKWRVEGTRTDLQRTQWGKKPVLVKDADGTNFLRVPLSTFNPNYEKTGAAMLGTQVGSNQAFGLGAGLEYETRIRSNHLPLGLVLGFFTYNAAGVWQDSYQKTEIDFEFIPKMGGNTILFNIWDNWNPSRGGPKSGTYPTIPNLNWNNDAWNTFKVRWYPGRTEWLVNGVIYRVETLVRPGSAMRVMFNLWAPDVTWPSAYDASLLVAPIPAQNKDFFFMCA
ncbi:Glycosyl hydrolases family 16 [Abditibacterium utsteinense]|uniref:Glycosyl hydrolases family 16 n=1 Tax=Abditibacterium utsteinense TaxID=1960156 RepID=A0A2S8SVM0_9BACT|nr:glycoside hydrolase family 16 protein [Abditibacterium utsteinense]PQV64835.1 Glycosyl hydrolases family 16 [Abditibacterium utsteinense]